MPVKVNEKKLKHELYDIKNMSLAIYENDVLDEQTIIDTQESIIALLEEQETTLEILLNEKQQEVEYYKTLAKMYTEKAKIIDERNNKTKDIIKDIMRINNIKKTGAFSLRNTKGKVIIDDEQKVPGEFKKIIQEEKIDKNAIYDKLKTGIEIPGVHLEKNQTLVIR